MDRTRFSINWDLCVLCQLDNTTEKLVSPVYDKRKDRGSGYKSLAENLPKFKEAGEWPIQVPLSLLDDGGGLRVNKASWHKTCFNKCSSAKLTRAQKRKHAEASKESDEETSEQPSPVKTRHTTFGHGETSKPSTKDGTERCFFCDELGKEHMIINFGNQHIIEKRQLGWVKYLRKFTSRDDSLIFINCNKSIFASFLLKTVKVVVFAFCMTSQIKNIENM